jgi:ADP-heptose:LPS heptosyltransferase
VVVTGGPAERSLAEQVAALAGLPAGAVAAGRTSLAGLARLVAGADLVVCGDTGVAHLATATGARSVLLFGPVPPTEWGPVRDLDRHVVLWSGRRGDPHGATPDPGLLAIGVPQVLAAARGLLAGGGRVRARTARPPE